MKPNRSHSISLAHALTFTYALVLFSTPLAGAAENADGKKSPSDIPVVLVKTVDLHALFEKATAEFKKKNAYQSAAAISEASKLVTQQAEAAVPPHGEPLLNAAGGLNELAKSVGIGEVTDIQELEIAFATAHHSLATFYHGKAGRVHQGGDSVAAGKALQAVANHAENSVRWAGTQLSEGSKKTVGLLRNAGGTLVSGAGEGAEKVGNVLGMGAELLANVGKKITRPRTAEQKVEGAAPAPALDAAPAAAKTTDRPRPKQD